MGPDARRTPHREAPVRSSTKTNVLLARLDVVAKHPREAAADVPGLVVARANVTFETIGRASASGVLARSRSVESSVCVDDGLQVAEFVQELHPLDAELDLGGDDLRRAAVTGDRGSARDFGRGFSMSALLLATSAVPSAEEARGDARALNASST